MKIRRIIEDYEAKLTPADVTRVGRQAKGKAEWEAYSNGEEEFSLRLRNIELEDGTMLDVYLSGRHIGRITIDRSHGEMKIESGNGRAVPRAQDADKILVALQGSELLVGIFEPD